MVNLQGINQIGLSAPLEKYYIKNVLNQKAVTTTDDILESIIIQLLKKSWQKSTRKDWDDYLEHT